MTLLTLGLASVILSSSTLGEDKQSVIKYFKNACMACHTVPDPNLAEDKSWISQLPGTA